MSGEYDDGYSDGYRDGERCGLFIARAIVESTKRLRVPFKERVNYIVRYIDERVDEQDKRIKPLKGGRR